MIMLRNNTDGQVTIGTTVLEAGQSIYPTVITQEIIDAVNAGTLTSSQPLVAFTSLSDLPGVATANGTAVAAVNGGITIPAVTDFPSAANAVATLAALVLSLNIQLNVLRTQLNNTGRDPANEVYSDVAGTPAGAINTPGLNTGPLDN